MAINMTRLKHGFQDRTSGVARFVMALHHGLALIGLAAVIALLAHGGKVIWERATDHSAIFGSIRYGTESVLERVENMSALQQKVLVNYLSRRYRVSAEATEQMVMAAYDAGHQVGLDPLLILAVMAIESRLNPIAESWVGAKGLMQVIPKHHLDKVAEHGGEVAMLKPSINILLGARILKDYIRRTGSVETGLQTYNGALADTSSQYAQKVIAERERLRQAMRKGDAQPQLVRNSV